MHTSIFICDTLSSSVFPLVSHLFFLFFASHTISSTLSSPNHFKRSSWDSERNCFSQTRRLTDQLLSKPCWKLMYNYPVLLYLFGRSQDITKHSMMHKMSQQITILPKKQIVPQLKIPQQMHWPFSPIFLKSEVLFTRGTFRVTTVQPTSVYTPMSCLSL